MEGAGCDTQGGLLRALEVKGPTRVRHVFLPLAF